MYLETYLYRIVAPKYVAGFCTWHDGWVYRTAPVLKWAKGKHILEVARACRRRGYKLEKV